MGVLEIIGLIAILVGGIFVVLIFANWFCQPVRGNGALVRMANRAKRETEQMLYTLVCGLILAVFVIIFYALFGI